MMEKREFPETVGRDWVGLAREMWDGGYSADEIGKACGVSRSLIHKVSRTAAWPAHPRKKNRIRRQIPGWLQREFEVGVPADVLGRRWGRGEQRVYEVAKQLNWDWTSRKKAMGIAVTPEEVKEKKRRGDVRRQQRRREAAGSVYERRRLRMGRRSARQVGWDIFTRKERALAERRRRKQERPKRKLLSPTERREYWREYQARRRREQPTETQARRAVQRAVESGEMIKPDRCEVCGEKTPQEELHGHHHNGYEAPHQTDVTWVCVGCHVEEEGAWGGQMHRDRAA